MLTNAVVTWCTEYYCLAVAELRAAGRDIPGEVLAASPRLTVRTAASSASSPVGVEAGLAKPGDRGLRYAQRGTGQASGSAR